VLEVSTDGESAVRQHGEGLDLVVERRPEGGDERSSLDVEGGKIRLVDPVTPGGGALDVSEVAPDVDATVGLCEGGHLGVLDTTTCGAETGDSPGCGHGPARWR